MTSANFSNTRYENTLLGGYDYVLEMDMRDFLPSQIRVTLNNGIITIQAETLTFNHEGIKVRHEFKREIQLPNNVRTANLRSRYMENGILELRAPVDTGITTDIYRYPTSRYLTNGYTQFQTSQDSSQNGWNSGSTFNKRNVLPKMEYIPVRSQSSIGYRPRSKSPVKIIYDLEPSNSKYNSVRSMNNYSAPLNGSSIPPMYVHRIEIDPIFKPENITVAVENDMVIVRAVVDRDNRTITTKGGVLFEPYHDSNWTHREFKCEHSLPHDVDISGLKAELVRGYLVLKAPYKNFNLNSTVKPRIIYEVPINS